MSKHCRCSPGISQKNKAKSNNKNINLKILAIALTGQLSGLECSPDTPAVWV